MYEAKLAVVYILIATSACVGCSGPYWASLRNYRPIHHVVHVPARNCDTENKNTLAEIKSEIQNLQRLVVGLCQKLDPDFKLLHPNSVLPLNCDTEYTNKLVEIKSEIRNLQQLVVGLRQKLDSDLKLSPPLCHMKADVIFVLDASSSISGPDFKQQLDFVRTVIRDIQIDPSMVRCGLVTYGDKIRMEFGLRTYSSAESAIKAVSLVRQLRGNTRTDLAIQTVRQMMADDKRSGVPHIGIIITDGQSDNQTATRVEAEAAHQAGITMFAVGVGKNVDDRELGSIASQKDFRFNVESFAGLETIRKILTTRACDVESKNDQTTEPTPPQNVTAMCPPGFTYLPSAGNCYKVLYESHNWYSAGKKCQELHRGSHLAAITSATENKVLKTFLASELSRNVGNTACSVTKDWSYGGDAFWTSGQRIIERDCKSPFVWKPSSDKQLPFAFTNWAPTDPNCYGSREDCVLILPQDDFVWVDIWCTAKMCPLCEYNP